MVQDIGNAVFALLKKIYILKSRMESDFDMSNVVPIGTKVIQLCGYNFLVTIVFWAFRCQRIFKSGWSVLLVKLFLQTFSTY